MKKLKNTKKLLIEIILVKNFKINIKRNSFIFFLNKKEYQNIIYLVTMKNSKKNN